MRAAQSTQLSGRHASCTCEQGGGAPANNATGETPDAMRSPAESGGTGRSRPGTPDGGARSPGRQKSNPVRLQSAWKPLCVEGRCPQRNVFLFCGRYAAPPRMGGRGSYGCGVRGRRGQRDDRAACANAVGLRAGSLSQRLKGLARRCVWPNGTQAVEDRVRGRSVRAEMADPMCCRTQSRPQVATWGSAVPLCSAVPARRGCFEMQRPD